MYNTYFPSVRELDPKDPGMHHQGMTHGGMMRPMMLPRGPGMRTGHPHICNSRPEPNNRGRRTVHCRCEDCTLKQAK